MSRLSTYSFRSPRNQRNNALLVVDPALRAAPLGLLSNLLFPFGKRGLGHWAVSFATALLERG